MSRLIDAMKVLTSTFKAHAGKEGDETTLTKKELIELLRSEFPVQDYSPQQADIDNFFGMLDEDGDGVVNFKEFVTFVTAITLLTIQSESE